MQAADVVTPMRDKVKMLSEEFPGAETRTIRVALSANHGDVPAAAAMLRGQQRQVRQEAVSPGDEEDPATRKRKVAESLTRVRRNFAAMQAAQQGAQVEGAPARQMEPEDLARGDTLRDGSRTPSAWGESDSACSSPSPLKSSPIVSSELRSDDSKKTAAGPGGRARGDHSGVGTEAEPEAEAETIVEAAVEDEAESGRAQASSLDAATSTAAATSTEVGAGVAPEPAPAPEAGAGASGPTTPETVAEPATVTEAGAAVVADEAGSEPAGGDNVECLLLQEETTQPAEQVPGPSQSSPQYSPRSSVSSHYELPLSTTLPNAFSTPSPPSSPEYSSAASTTSSASRPSSPPPFSLPPNLTRPWTCERCTYVHDGPLCSYLCCLICCEHRPPTP